MKRIFLLPVLTLLTNALLAQSVGIGTNTPSPTAVLHVDAGTSVTNGLLVTGTFNPAATIPDLGIGSRLMFYPGKGAFRVGYVTSSVWNNTNVGIVSVGLGYQTQASGRYSTAIGAETIASGVISLATGYRTLASGDVSTAMGQESTASGEISMALGYLTTAKARCGIAIGLANDNNDAPNSEQPHPTDRIFQIGNGIGENIRSNAVTVLRNGNVGIGRDALAPAYRLDIDARMRIRSGGNASSSAGVWLNKNDNSGLLGFVGVDGNNDIGIFSSTSNWSFLVNTTNGNAWVKGTVTANGVTLTSDERLKKDIVPLGDAMPLLEKLNGYQYHWKDETWDANLQTGLLAQEVEKVLPELVKTDDKGMKSVNYLGLMPYMLEAAKEQQSTILEQQSNILEQQSTMLQLQTQLNDLKKLVEQLAGKQ